MLQHGFKVGILQLVCIDDVQAEDISDEGAHQRQLCGAIGVPTIQIVVQVIVVIGTQLVHHQAEMLVVHLEDILTSHSLGVGANLLAIHLGKALHDVLHPVAESGDGVNEFVTFLLALAVCQPVALATMVQHIVHNGYAVKQMQKCLYIVVLVQLMLTEDVLG